MKIRARLVAMIFLAFCFALSYACSKKAQDLRWSANIEIVDGIKVITNPEEPKFGVFAFDLEEELSIGDVNDEDYFFPRRVTLNVDDDGNIYVCDGGNIRVQKYDKNGTYLRTIGRQGQGPGEYMYPAHTEHSSERLSHPLVGKKRQNCLSSRSEERENPFLQSPNSQ